MIKIENLNKKYGTRAVLKRINHEFPDHGISVIYGPSGSGKTTLLNCIAGLIPYEGSIQVDKQNIEVLSDNDLSQLRLNSYGFVFQDFKLFDNETVLTNLLFPLETLYSLSKTKKIRKCKDLLNLVGLENKEKQVVNKLSGGEKQRVAIARALINDPRYILADEPTGALDEQNGIEIMNLLKKISRKALVIIVSHDQTLTRKYADEIVKMDDGEIASTVRQNADEEDYHLPVLKNGVPKSKPSIPDSFLINHTFHTMKQKKIRTGICYMMTSLGLIGVGLAFALSNTIGDNIKQAYKEVVDDNSMVVSLKDKSSSVIGQYAASYYEVKDIKETYPEYVEDIGITYYCNFEKFFVDTNELVIEKGNRRSSIPGFSARHINEFEWIEDIKTTVYPQPVEKLLDDEIIVSLNYSTLRDICFELQIERNINSLSNYLADNELKVYFNFNNYEWQYSDQQLLRIVGFTVESDLKIYHSNHSWNEYMFEERMSFPSNDALSVKDKEPWVMKKIYYLKAKGTSYDLLNLLNEEKEFDNYLFEIANETYYPWLYYQKKMDDRNRILVFMNTIAHIPNWHIPYILSNDSNLLTPVIGNDSGYLIYPETLMMGFSKTMYFSKDEDLIYEIVDKHTSKNKDGFYEEDLPDGVLSGNYAKSLQNGVKFEVFDEKTLQKGTEPVGLDEIVVSRGFMEKCHINDIDETIFITTPKKELITNTGGMISDYEVVSLKITGVVDSYKNIIYHHKNWTKLFYQCKIGISAYELQTTTLAFSLKNSKDVNNSISLFKKAFPDYNVVNPLSDVNESVDTVCFYITIVLIVFSFIATLISVLLLTICNYLYILEGKKEIALARCIGVNKKESKKFLYYHSIIQCLLSFAVASVELLFITVVANMEIGTALNAGFHFSFNPIAFVPMLILAVSVAMISSFVMSRRINKINPIDALKQ